MLKLKQTVFALVASLPSLSADARREVVQLLRDTAFTTFADACTYADRIRSDPDMTWLKPYHFIDVAQNATEVSAEYCGDYGCALEGISRFSQQFVESQSAYSRAEALMLVGHFVGDIHQPLHVSYREDHGGNALKVTFLGESSNLHRVWDSAMLMHASPNQWRALGAQVIDDYHDVALPAVKDMDVLHWADESLAITRQAYAALPTGLSLGQDYQDRFYPVITQRLYIAGKRLALLLEQLVDQRQQQKITLSDTFSRLAAGDPAAGYYQKLDSDLQGEALAVALQKIIQPHKHFSDSQIWEQLEYTDEDPANAQHIILLYSGRSTAKALRVGNSHSTDAWNREHVWAKSHGFGQLKGDPRYTDLHHLRPADQTVNADRGDKDFDKGGLPHREVAQALIDEDSFQPPPQVQGDIARMMFYMATAYRDQLSLVNGETRNPQPQFGHLCTLLDWHQQDPVSSWEQRRNNRIFERQQNRNPFIDYPGFAQKIWGQRCDL